jgi:hypothetical protein
MVPYFGGRLSFQIIGLTPAADDNGLLLLCVRCKSENSIVRDRLRHNKRGDVRMAELFNVLE